MIVFASRVLCGRLQPTRCDAITAARRPSHVRSHAPSDCRAPPPQESVVSFRDVRAPLLRRAFEEVHQYLAAGGTRRDQLLVDFARWRHQLPSLHLPLRLRAKILHDGYRHRYAAR